MSSSSSSLPAPLVGTSGRWLRVTKLLRANKLHSGAGQRIDKIKLDQKWLQSQVCLLDTSEAGQFGAHCRFELENSVRHRQLSAPAAPRGPSHLNNNDDRPKLTTVAHLPGPLGPGRRSGPDWTSGPMWTLSQVANGAACLTVAVGQLPPVARILPRTANVAC